jgi:hypothetical protein
MKLCLYSLLIGIVIPYFGIPAIAKELRKNEDHKASHTIEQINLSKTSNRAKRLTEYLQGSVDESPYVSQENSANLQDIIVLLGNLDNRNKRDRDEIDNFIYTLKEENMYQDIVPEEKDANEEIIYLLQEVLNLMRLESELEQERLIHLVNEINEKEEGGEPEDSEDSEDSEGSEGSEGSEESFDSFASFESFESDETDDFNIFLEVALPDSSDVDTFR